ncbi:MAG: hypothetical protein P1V97_07165 [Planctomycetota bacterium]|nr:hypothetical protein [Planctomycetota bacterium]
MLKQDEKHCAVCGLAETRRRVLGVLTQFESEAVAEALVDEVLARVSELPCTEACEGSSHLDVVYCLSLDMIIEYRQDLQQRRLEAKNAVPSAVELKQWFEG